MSSTDTIINILPAMDTPLRDADHFKSKGYTVTTEELTERPVLNRNNTGLRNFLGNTQENQNVGYDSEVVTLRLLGRIYNKILTFSIVTRYAFYVFPVAIMLGIPLIVFATVDKHLNIQGI